MSRIGSIGFVSAKLSTENGNELLRFREENVSYSLPRYSI